MISLLGVGLDYAMLTKDPVRGDVWERQLLYAKMIKKGYFIIYSPKGLDLRETQIADNLIAIPTNSRTRFHFVWDALRIGRQLCEKENFDVITAEDPHATGLVGYLLKKLYNIPLNIQMHNSFINDRYWLKEDRLNPFLNSISKWLVKNADTIRVVGASEKKKLVQLGISEWRIEFVPVSVDISRFSAGNGQVMRKKLLEDKYDTIVLFVGRLELEKDIPTLFRAFSLVTKERPRSLLVIVGKGSRFEELKKLRKQLDIVQNVKFLGAISHDILPEYYSASDIFVLPSLFEGRGTVLVEAALARLPVITTFHAGTDDVVEDGETGFVFKQKDYATLAKKILYLLDNQDMARKMGQKCLQHTTERLKSINDVSLVVKLWEKTATIGCNGF
ncbi:MAG: glycosyltransferase family 4 protein [bacterium]